MGTGYVRNDTANNIADGNIINAADLDGEFDAIESAFNSSTGHTHDGTSAEGGAILVLGPSQEFVVSSTEAKPSANAGLSLGTSLLQFNDLYVDGKAYIDGLGESILVDTNSKIQFRDTALFINSSADGQLDIEADTTIELTAPTVSLTNDLKLASDSAVLSFGADDEITVTHVHNTGLDLKNATGFDLNLQTSDTTIESGNLIGKITFNAPDEASGTDAILVGASIEAVAEDTFDSSTNSTALVFKTNTTGAATERMRLTSAGDLHFLDNRKAIFGAGSDLQIYHDGSNSYIKDAGQGNLYITATDLRLGNADNSKDYLRANDGGAVSLLYNAGVKLATSSTGIDVTGTVTADGLTFDVADFVNITTKESLGITIDSDNNQSSRNFTIFNDGTTKKLFRAEDTGDISFYEDTGTTAKFFWDASAEALSVGSTTNNSGAISATIGTGNYAYRMYRTDGQEIGGLYNATNGAGLFLKDSSGNSDVVLSSYGDSYFLAGNVGIGTSSPSKSFVVSDGGAMGIELSPDDAGQGYSRILNYDRNASVYEPLYIEAEDLRFSTGTSATERMRIDSSGNVGIGVSAPSTWSLGKALHIGVKENNLWGEADYAFHMNQNAYYNSGWKYTHTDQATRYSQEDGKHTWHYAASGTADAALTWSEAMRIDSSGNLLVGKTSAGSADGVELLPSGQVAATRDSNPPLFLRRDSSDGDLAEFYREGTKVGSIGSASGATIYIDGGSQFAGLQFGGDGSSEGRITPRRNGASADAATDLGTSSLRFKDLYLSSSVKITGSGDKSLTMTSGTGSVSIINMGDADDIDIGQIAYDNATNSMQFKVNASERMRIDSSGNLLVGKTADNLTDAGQVFTTAGSSFTRSGGAACQFNRNTSDGEIVRLSKDGTTVGSIGNHDASSVYIGSSDTGLRFNHVSDSLTAYNPSTGANRDAAVDLGYSSIRYKDLYLSGGVYLGGTGSANKLDDYEEGTWTPQVYYQDATDQANATNTVQSGKYVKIGTLVFVQFRLDFSQSSSSPANNNIGVKNLPFAAAHNHYGGTGNLITNAGVTGINFQTPSAGTTLAVLSDSANGGNYGDNFGSGSGKFIRGSFTYLTS